MKRAWVTGMLLGICLLMGGCNTENDTKSAAKPEPETLEASLQETEEGEKDSAEDTLHGKL